MAIFEEFAAAPPPASPPATGQGTFENRDFGAGSRLRIFGY
jgi:hypothetical protein